MRNWPSPTVVRVTPEAVVSRAVPSGLVRAMEKPEPRRETLNSVIWESTGREYETFVVPLVVSAILKMALLSPRVRVLSKLEMELESDRAREW